VIKNAMRRVLAMVLECNECLPSSLNIALTDGEVVVVTRFRNSTIGEEPPSLYLHQGPLPGEKEWDLDNVGGFDKYMTDGGEPGGKQEKANERQQMRRAMGSCEKLLHEPDTHTSTCVMVASEPLSVDGDGSTSRWILCPANTLLCIQPKRPCHSGIVERSELVASHNKRGGQVSSTDPILDLDYTCLGHLCCKESVKAELLSELHGTRRTRSFSETDEAGKKAAAAAAAATSELTASTSAVLPRTTSSPVSSSPFAVAAAAAVESTAEEARDPFDSFVSTDGVGGGRDSPDSIGLDLTDPEEEASHAGAVPVPASPAARNRAPPANEHDRFFAVGSAPVQETSRSVLLPPPKRGAVI